MPVWTTAELSIDAGKPVPASALPLSAASVHASKATLFVFTSDIAHATLAKVIGEAGGTLYVDPGVLPAGTKVVTDGRTVLSDGDTIAPTVEPWTPDPAGRP